MRVALARFLIAIIAVAFGTTAFAQFGHPLKGSWSGDWGTSKESRTRVLLEFHWDGKAITGTINPGPNAVTLEKATLDPSSWAVHLEAEGKDAAGKAVRYVIDGKIENIGAYQRVLSGTWTEGAKKGDFRVVRN
jgi:hypothetical protein